MYPYIHILDRDFPSYMLMAVIGFAAVLSAVWPGCRKRDDVDQTQMVHIVLAAMGGLVVGGHLLYGVVNWKLLWTGISLVHTAWDAVGLLMTAFGGMVFYGGLVGAIVGTIWYLKAVKLPIAPYMDVFAFSVPLFHGFARIGCFLGGCCYGIESSFGVTYHHAILASANGVSRFPVQLLESGLNFLLFAVLFALYRKNKFQHKLIYLYLISYAVIRFFDEFLRGDRIRGFVGILSTSQFISMLVLLSVVVMLMIDSRKSSQNSTLKPQI